MFQRAPTRAARHPVEGTGADIRQRAGPWPGNGWCAVWYVRCFAGPPRRPGAFPSGLARGRPGSCDRSGTCRSRARFITGVCAVLRLARAALVSGARRTADAERRRRPLSGVIVEAPLERVRRAPQHGPRHRAWVQGQELADRVVTHHDLVGNRGDPARSRWPCRRRSREPARGGQARAEQRDGHHLDAAQHHDLLQHWAPRCRVPGASPPATSAPRLGSAHRRGWSAGAVVAAGMACCRGHAGPFPARAGPGRLAAKPEAPPASAFTAATGYSRPR